MTSVSDYQMSTYGCMCWQHLYVKVELVSLKKRQINHVTHCYIFLFPKETHSDVVPEWGALRHSTGSHSVLVHGYIKVTVGLHHAACSQDGLGIKPVIGDIKLHIMTDGLCHLTENDLLL